MDVKDEFDIEDEPLDGMEYDGVDEQILRLLQIQDASGDSVIDIKSEIEIKKESLNIRMDDSEYDEILKLIPEKNEMKNLIFEEDHKEIAKVLEGKGSSGSDFQELRRESKGNENHDWKEFYCSNCDFTFESEEELMSHLESLCKGKVKCSRCICDCNCESKSKKDSLNLRNKDQSILKTKSFKCSEFDYECKQKAHLKSHLLRPKIKLFKYFDCDYVCNLKESLKRHMLSHQNIKLFKCFECSYECNQKGSLKLHMLPHKNIKLFKCSQCDYESNQKGNLKRHMLTHKN